MDRPGAALLLTASCLWGATHVVVRAVHGDVPLTALVFWRWSLTLLGLVPIAALTVRNEWPILRAHWRFVALLGVVSAVLFTYAILGAPYVTEAMNVGLLQATTPIWIAALGAATGLERIGPWSLVGILLAALGVVLITLEGDLSRLGAFAFKRGDLVALAAALLWAVYSLLLRKKPPGLGQIALLWGIAAAGVIVLLPVYLAALSLGMPAAVRAGAEHGPLAGWAAILYVGIGATLIGNLFWNIGVARVGAARAGAYLYLSPVFAGAFAIAFLGERLHLFHAVAVPLIALGLWLTTSPGPGPQRSAARNSGDPG